MAQDGFQGGRRGSTFACGICQRLTRATAAQGNSHLCPQCDEWAMVDNGLSDGLYETPEEVAKAEAQILNLKRAALAKGGSAERLGLAS